MSPCLGLVMMPPWGEEECSGGEVRGVDESVGDSLRTPSLLLVPSMRPLLIRSVSWKAKIRHPFQQGLGEFLEFDQGCYGRPRRRPEAWLAS